MKALSPRQAQAMALSLEGHKQTAIAGAMRISVTMVKKHLRAALAKCGKQTRVEAAFFLGRRRYRLATCPKGQLTLKL